MALVIAIWGILASIAALAIIVLKSRRKQKDHITPIKRAHTITTGPATPLEDIDFEELVNNLEQEDNSVCYYMLSSVLTKMGYDTNFEQTLAVVEILEEIGITVNDVYHARRFIRTIQAIKSQ